MTSALPINPIRPMMPKKTGTIIDTIRSSGQSVSYPLTAHADEFAAKPALELHIE